MTSLSGSQVGIRTEYARQTVRFEKFEKKENTHIKVSPIEQKCHQANRNVTKQPFLVDWPCLLLSSLLSLPVLSISIKKYKISM